MERLPVTQLDSRLRGNDELWRAVRSNSPRPAVLRLRLRPKKNKASVDTTLALRVLWYAGTAIAVPAPSPKLRREAIVGAIDPDAALVQQSECSDPGGRVYVEFPQAQHKRRNL